MKKCLLVCMCLLLVLTACGKKKESENVSTADGKGKVDSAVENKTTDNFNPTGLPILNEPKEFEIYAQQISTIEEANNKAIVKQTNAETNVITNFIEVPGSSWKEKVNILFSTSSLPDAFLGDIGVGDKYFQLTPLDEYLTEELAPNTVAFFNSRPEYWEVLKAPDGHIYSLPVGDESYWNVIDSQIWINTEWLKAVGKEMPTTIDEFYDVLVAFKEGDPNGNGDTTDEIPFTFREVWGWGTALENAFGPFGVLENDDHVMTIDGKVTFSAAQEGYFEALKFFNKLYAEGLVDEEAFTHSWEQYKPKLAADVDKYGVYISYNTNREDIYAPLLLETNDGQKIIGMNNVEKKEGFAITEFCKDPAALVRWYDYVNRDLESLFSWNRGVQGDTWEFFDGEGDYKVRPIKNEELWAKHGAKNLGEMRGIQAFAGISPAFMDMGDFAIYDEGARPKIVFNMDVVDKDYGILSLPAGFATPENSEQRSLLKADIDTYLKQFVAVSIYEGITDADWAKHLEVLKDLRVDEYTQLCQEYVDGK